MQNRKVITNLFLFTLFAFGSRHAIAGIIFDSSFYGDQASHQVPGNMNGADNGLLGKILVSAPTPITNFAVFTAQDGSGDLKFLIYDQTTSTFLYKSSAVAVSADNLSADNPFTAKLSPTFALTLLSTDVYYIGAIADSSTYYLFGASNNPDNPPGPAQPVTQNGITGPVENLLVANFTNPMPAPGGGAQLSLQIFNGTTAVPEPATWTLMGTCLGALLSVKLRRRSRS